jgi:uncharacterized FlaG/YvyC family protein
MPTLTGIQGGAKPPAIAAVETQPHPVPASPAGGASAPPAKDTAENPQAPLVELSRQDLEDAVAQLGAAMAKLPGGERVVQLLYEEEDHSYIIEIRDKESGVLVQTFPPEKLLNLRGHPAEMLGVLIDRRS